MPKQPSKRFWLVCSITFYNLLWILVERIFFVGHSSSYWRSLVTTIMQRMRVLAYGLRYFDLHAVFIRLNRRGGRGRRNRKWARTSVYWNLPAPQVRERLFPGVTACYSIGRGLKQWRQKTLFTDQSAFSNFALYVTKVQKPDPSRTLRDCT